MFFRFTVFQIVTLTMLKCLYNIHKLKRDKRWKGVNLCAVTNSATCFNSTFTESTADNVVRSPSPALEYSGSVWVFAPTSSLLLLRPNGFISSIHNHLALTLFGYSKDELLGKVSQPDRLNKAAEPPHLITHFCFSSTECHFPDAWFLWMDV